MTTGRHEPLRTGSASAEESTGLMLWRVTNAWQAAQRSALRPFDLTHVQFVLLASLVWLRGSGAVTQRRLADHAGTDTMMTSQVLRALEARGLIERAPHPTDARARALRPTSAGTKLANRAVGAVEAVDAEFFGPLGARRTAFTKMLGTVHGASIERSRGERP